MVGHHDPTAICTDHITLLCSVRETPMPVGAARHVEAGSLDRRYGKSAAAIRTESGKVRSAAEHSRRQLRGRAGQSPDAPGAVAAASQNARTIGTETSAPNDVPMFETWTDRHARPHFPNTCGIILARGH